MRDKYRLNWCLLVWTWQAFPQSGEDSGKYSDVRYTLKRRGTVVESDTSGSCLD